MKLCQINNMSDFEMIMVIYPSFPFCNKVVMRMKSYRNNRSIVMNILYYAPFYLMNSNFAYDSLKIHIVSPEYLVEVR